MLFTLAGAADRGLAGCKLAKVAELPVTMIGLRPVVHAQINGADALFIADSGAFFSTLSSAAAERFKLQLYPAPDWFRLHGVGGDASARITSVRTFTIFKVPIPNVDFLVAGNDFGAGAVGLLGQNVFRLSSDIEYDLANGVIRLMQPSDCGKAMLAYWAASQSASVVDIEHATRTEPHTMGAAFLNGTKIRVTFDTGAATSLLTLAAAKRAGITPESPGVVPAGVGLGIGREPVSTWIAPFQSFKIGDEEIRNTHLRIAAGGLPSSDMLIGADFFLSHRVYVANSQSKLYFTYNGGPVFNLTAEPQGPDNDRAPNSPVPGSPPPSSPPPAGK
jgi:predicted aspartyl protease